MKEFRALLLVFFSIITTRLLNESASCQSGLEAICNVGIALLVPFLVSAYLVDSLFAEFIFGEDKKNKITSLLLSIPYILSIGFFIYYFFATMSLVTIEYVLNFKLLLILPFFLAAYWVNSKPKIRRLNKAFMVTFLLAIVVFQFI